MKYKLLERFYIFLVAGLIIALSLKRCQDKNITSFVKVEGIQSENISAGWRSNVRIRKSDSGVIQKADGGNVGSPNEQHSTVGKSTVIIADIPTRGDNTIQWDTRTGELDYKWYGTSVAPGLSIIRRKEDTGLGVDIRGLYAGDFGAQAGFGLYKKEAPIPQVSIGYNLRRAKILSNVDVIAGIDLKKTFFVGLRTELGNWRK